MPNARASQNEPPSATAKGQPAAPGGSSVPLRDPLFAAFLAFLLPGLGHFYQRRTFKGALYMVCILGTFFWGMRIGHGQVVYFNWHSSENRTYAYLCQFWVGAPALPALAQSQLREVRLFDPNYVPQELTAPFRGTLAAGETDLEVTGQMALRPQDPEARRGRWEGTLTGTIVTADGPLTVQGEITPGFDGQLDPEVAPTSERRLAGRFDGRIDGQSEQPISGLLVGNVHRSLWNSYGAPFRDVRIGSHPNDMTDLDRAHYELGSRFELGVVFTMIAGLLNILAIYDALDGPAYEREGEEPPGDKPPPDAK